MPQPEKPNLFFLTLVEIVSHSIWLDLLGGIRKPLPLGRDTVRKSGGKGGFFRPSVLAISSDFAGQSCRSIPTPTPRRR